VFYRKKGKRRSKALNLRWHTKKRIFERYGIILNRNLLNEIKKKIKTGNADFLKRHSLRVKEIEVLVEAKNVRLLYDANRHEVITCLPPRRFSRNKPRV